MRQGEKETKFKGMVYQLAIASLKAQPITWSYERPYDLLSQNNSSKKEVWQTKNSPNFSDLPPTESWNLYPFS